MKRGFTIRSIEKIFQGKFSSANRIELLWKGKESFETIFHAIRDAKQFICLQFYIFKDDETGRALADLLIEKSRQGAKVFVLYDHLGSFGTSRSFWREMRRGGILVRASHPFKWTAPFHYVRRDHRKLIIIDLKKAFTGGLNIANEYSGWFPRRKGRGWRDTGVMVEGPVVKELFETFQKSWMTWGGERILVWEEEQGLQEQSEKERIPVLPIFVYSGKGRRRMRRLLRYSIESARRTISFTTAYFTPSRRMIALLEGAVRRGVKVRLLVPGKSDVPAASYAGRAFFTRLLRSGIEIYTYLGEMLHAKTYVFDRYWSIVGSTNLDYQSLLYNDEGNIGILDASFASKLTEIFEEDLKNSRKIELEEWQRRPWLEKLKEHFFALFRKRL